MANFVASLGVLVALTGCITTPKSTVSDLSRAYLQGGYHYFLLRHMPGVISMYVVRSALLGLVFLFSNSVKSEEIRLEARAGVYPSCLFTDSGLGKRSGLGFRSVCDATFGVGIGRSDFPILLDVDRHLLYASPNIKTTEGYLLNMSSLITTVLASSTMKIGAQNNLGLLYGMGLFFGQHSFNLELPDPGTMGNSRRVIS